MSIYKYSAANLAGEEVPLETWRGRVLLIVNTASQCGFTPQYAGLEALYKKLEPRGLTVLGFPCNQFGAQEPGSSAEISAFCEKNYSVSFPMFEKIEVNGSNTHPLFQFLKNAAPGVIGTEGIKWNFTKFLVDREGKVLSRYAPLTTPAQLETDISALLGAR